MNDLPNWLIGVITIVGAISGAYVGVRVGIAKLEKGLLNVEANVTILRQRSHDLANALQGHTMELLQHERRIGVVESDIKIAGLEREKVISEVAVLKSKVP